MQSYIGLEDNFLLENGYLVARLEEIVLSATDSARFTKDEIDEIFRVMHTIKSSAGIMMYDNISILAHKLEDVFCCLRESYPENTPHDELAEGILKTADFITAELVKIRSGVPADGDGAEIIAYLRSFLDKLQAIIECPVTEHDYEMPEQFYIAPKAGEGKKYYEVSVFYRLGTQMSNVCAYSLIFALGDITDELKYKPDDLLSDDCAGEILRNGFKIKFSTMSDKVTIGDIIKSSSGEKEFEINDSSIEEYLRGFPESEVSDLIINLDDDWQDPDDDTDSVAGAYVIEKEAGKVKSISGIPSRLTPAQEIYQVPIDKIKELSDLVDKLREEEHLNTSLTELVNDVWKIVNSIKKVQVKSLFHKMDRAVYDIGHKLGKIVNFDAEGDEVEIDRNIVEMLSESLIHIVRNAIDHGIEDKEERKAAGKKIKGSIYMTAGVNGDEICICVSDDGRGLDTQRIYDAANEKGLTDGRGYEQYDKKEIYNFILLPGFSTNKRVTEYSGRGVGLDIVAHNITSLGGRLEIDSIPGQWTEMSLWLPE